jgi:hypothetical protein
MVNKERQKMSVNFVGDSAIAQLKFVVLFSMDAKSLGTEFNVVLINVLSKKEVNF